MKFIKLKIVLVCLFLNVFSVSAHAGLPVIDGSALAQHILQLAEWAKQIAAMKQQYDQMKQQYEQAIQQTKALTGSRGVSMLLNDDSVRQALPTDFVAGFDTIRKIGTAGASADARAIYDQIRTFACSEQFPDNQEAKLNCEAKAMATPTSVALINKAITSSQDRAKQIKSLIASIDGATDAKHAADLSNRITSEIALLQNEKTMMDFALEKGRQEDALAQEKSREIGIKRMQMGTGENPFSK